MELCDLFLFSLSPLSLIPVVSLFQSERAFAVEMKNEME